MNRTVILTGLAIVVIANVLMLYYNPYNLRIDNFQNVNANVNANVNMNVDASSEIDVNTESNVQEEEAAVEGFQLSSAAGARKAYQPMGQYDGVKLSTGNTISDWRYTAPNEPLTGPAFEPGDDALFMFKNNQCKPECCGASFSCGGGCVCTTPKQRDYINTRGGNRTISGDF